VRFYNRFVRDTGFTLEAVDVLREELEQEALVVEEPDEGVRDRRPVFAGIELAR